MFGVALIIAFFIRLGTGGNHIEEHVVGGYNAFIEDFPYQLSIQELGKHFCGASIIGEKFALTAAHCVDGYNEEDLDIRSGTSYRESGGTLHRIQRILVHPKYGFMSMEYDIAVVEVKDSFIYGTTRWPVGLPYQDESVSAGTNAFISGWGRTEANDPRLPTQLQAAEVYIVDRNVCENAYKPLDITKAMICAGTQWGGIDTCQDDSGGPLVTEGVIFGIVSFGKACGDPNYPGIYTNVAYVRDWIWEKTRI